MCDACCRIGVHDPFANMSDILEACLPRYVVQWDLEIVQLGIFIGLYLIKGICTAVSAFWLS